MPDRRDATLARSIRLFRAFRHEQTDRDGFYRLLADDSRRQVSSFITLDDRLVLDVGGGPGYFADAFRAAGATYVGLDPDVGDLSGSDDLDRMIRASGTDLPVRNSAVDIAYSSNVLEHVDRPILMLEEMVRVTKPGGVVFVTFTPWRSPWGGHETSPWHWLGGEYAARRYRSRYGHEPKNRFGTSLFPLSVGTVLRWVRSRSDIRLIRTFPRYHPWWVDWIVHVPWVRDVLAWNVVLVLEKRP